MYRHSLLLVAIFIAAVAMSCSYEVEHPIRNADNNFVTIQTNHGNLVVELYRDVAPAHADSFLARTNDGFYDSLLVFRMIPGFMLQTGDPQNMGVGGPGYSLDAEFSEITHIKGTLSMARSQNINSAGSQFFVCFDTAQHLDNNYTVFGQMVNGYEVLTAIEKIPTGTSPEGRPDYPQEEVKIVKAYRSDPEGKAVN
ncbi:MAG: peptidylprolyl isomerase [candidate division Zixibacteria bacterium]